MKAKIHAKDGRFQDARDALKQYTVKVKGDQVATDLMFAISEAEAASEKARRAGKAQLWSSCSESASMALKTASHSVEMRQLRAECSLTGGDVESAIGDLTRLTQLSPPSTPSFVRIFRLAYFFLPPPTPPSTSPALTALKQCLHFDPDSKPCLQARRMVKSFDKSFEKLDKALEMEDWRGVIALVIGRDKGKPLGNGLLEKFHEAMEENASPLLLSSPSSPFKSLSLSGTKQSPLWRTLLRGLCRAYVQIDNARAGERWCDALLAMNGVTEDEDALVGKGEAALKKEEWEGATKFFERAFEASGKSNRDVRRSNHDG
jgi:DnaJ homolog subfamily C member 3